MIWDGRDIVFWFERKRTDSAVARVFDGERFHTGTGRDFFEAIADCIRVACDPPAAVGAPIELGKRRCPSCHGDGGMWLGETHRWGRCRACDGVGQAWCTGGPAFGCTMTLGDRDAGEIVELGTGERARIMWHAPRDAPDTTFVALWDDFTDAFESSTPVACSSILGVRSVAVATRAGGDLRDGEKDADLVDPIARRQREAELV